jgi:hypothetical protein
MCNATLKLSPPTYSDVLCLPHYGECIIHITLFIGYNSRIVIKDVNIIVANINRFLELPFNCVDPKILILVKTAEVCTLLNLWLRLLY